MKIAEIYCSRQGEGLLTGTECVFIRTSGCNLRCHYCDTPYTSWEPEGDDLSIDEILDETARFDATHVVLTGGEPMLFAELVPLSHELKRRGLHITVETAGTLHLPVRCDLMSISPKLANSSPSATEHPRWQRRHDRTRHAPEVIRRLVAEYDHQLKFVIDTPDDVDEVVGYLREFPEIDHQHVQLMPQGTSVEQLGAVTDWLEPRSAEHGFAFCPRRQIEWFGLTRRT